MVTALQPSEPVLILDPVRPLLRRHEIPPGPAGTRTPGTARDLPLQIMTRGQHVLNQSRQIAERGLPAAVCVLIEMDAPQLLFVPR